MKFQHSKLLDNNHSKPMEFITCAALLPIELDDNSLLYDPLLQLTETQPMHLFC